MIASSAALGFTRIGGQQPEIGPIAHLGVFDSHTSILARSAQRRSKFESVRGIRCSELIFVI